MKTQRSPSNRLIAASAAILIAVSLASPAWPQAPPTAPTWKDQGESDIGLVAENQPDPAKKLDLLKKWEQQYPDTAFQAQRTFMTTQALTSLITAGFGKPAGPALDAGKKAAQQLIDGLSTYFADSLRALPQLKKTSPVDWAKIRTTSEMQAHALLACIAALNKDDATSEAENRKVLALDPTQAASSYQLGVTIIRETAVTNNFIHFSEALYDLARSLWMTGPTALPPAGRAAAEKALKANYPSYHGSTDGLDDLMKQVANSALPPPGFHILSVVEISNAKAADHAAWAQQHPELDFWETIRTALLAHGDAFFANLQGVAFPPAPGDAYKGGAMFKGTVVSTPSSKQILVNVDDAAGDALLKFDDNIKGAIPLGTAIQFKGVVDAYTKTPTYVLTVDIQEPKTDIVGLPDDVKFIPDTAPRPRPATKAATKKK